MNNGGAMIINATEAERAFVKRLEAYKAAVQVGFYNEWPKTVVYKGYQIVPEGAKFAVVQHGVVLIQVLSVHIAKVWVTCRVRNIGLAEANLVVQEEDATLFCGDCASYVTTPHDCHD